jgi:HEXXH motif-containing protein
MLTRHVLAASDFDALAAGLGSPSAIGTLRAAQLSRRLIGLRAVLDAAEQAGYQEALPGLGLLCDVQRENGAAVAETLGYPFVGAWAAHCLRLLGGEGGDAAADLAHLSCIAAVAAIRAGLPFRIDVPVRDGAVYLPALGRLRVTGGPTVSLRHDGQTTAGGVPLSDPDRWQPARRYTWRVDGQPFTVALDDLDPFRGPRLPVASRLSDHSAREWEHSLAAAWGVLARHHRSYATAIGAGLTVIVPLTAARASQGMNATSRESFGAAAISAVADPVTLAVALLHEFQHGKLNAVLDLVALYGPHEGRYYAPWRQDPRPLAGLLHGAYAHVGVSDFWRVQARLPAMPHLAYAQMQFARWSDQTCDAIGCLLDSGHLTEAGERFVRRMRERVRSWTDPVPEEPARLAGTASADHRLGWRLRNVRPDSATIDMLAHAWSAGAAAPPCIPATTVRTDGGSMLGASNRLDLLHLWLREPGRIAQAAAEHGLDHADVQLVAGDVAAAAAAYRARIRAEPRCVDAWAGLALALREIRSGPRGGGAAPGVGSAGKPGESEPGALAMQTLLTGPEYVYDLYNRLLETTTGTALDPELLAAWLAPVFTAGPLPVSGREAPSQTQ